mmetsp:Transcript_136753/g.265984  ORF Transcript_136753/g.265984 Transcript_136753/m.265984 type:complete len:301 (-) Transcript_136753:302-1204(-)
MAATMSVAALIILSRFIAASAEICIHGKRGPRCSSNSDCVNQAGCVRCAHNGYCTDIPLPGPSPSPGPGPHYPTGCTSGNKSYDFLSLVQGWPKSGCLSRSCPGNYAKLDVFTMHGLWPSRIGDAAMSFPCKCDDRNFDSSKVSSIQDQLNQFWPSFNDNKEFWGHEWTKHGTCAADVDDLKDELSFFKTTLGLRQTHDIMDALQKASITPSSDKTYSAQEIGKALTPIDGFQPLIGCIMKSGKQYLHEVTFCIDKSLKDVNCDDSVRKLPHDEISDCDFSQPIVLAAPDSQARVAPLLV